MKTLLKTIGIVSTLIGSSFLFQNYSEKESIPEGIIPPDRLGKLKKSLSCSMK